MKETKEILWHGVAIQYHVHPLGDTPESGMIELSSKRPEVIDEKVLTLTCRNTDTGTNIQWLPTLARSSSGSTDTTKAYAKHSNGSVNSQPFAAVLRGALRPKTMQI